MTFNSLKIFINEVLNEFLIKEKFLLENDLHEQTITSKLSCYIDKILKEMAIYDYDVDVEYNRETELHKNKLDSKIIMDRLIKPDIVIHQRGNNLKNLLVIYAKKQGNKLIKNDIIDIQELIKSDNYKYEYGLSLILQVRSIKLSWYKLELDNRYRNVTFDGNFLLKY